MSRIFAAILALLFISEVYAAPLLRLRWESGKLTLDAEKVPLSEILDAIAAKTGMEVTGAELSREMTVHFNDAGLLQVLRELLAGVNYAISEGHPSTRLVIVGNAEESPRPALLDVPRKTDESSKPSEPATDLTQVPTFAPDPSATQTAESDAGGSSESAASPTEDKLAAIETAVTGADKNLLNALLRDSDAGVQSSAFQALAGQDRDSAIESLVAEIQDPTQPNRLSALQLLVQSAGADGQIVLDTLRQALDDPDPAFGAYAIAALAGLGNTGSIEALSGAFNRMDAATKLTIVQTVASTQTGLLLLQEAVLDSDETVSATAKDMLKQLSGHP